MDFRNILFKAPFQKHPDALKAIFEEQEETIENLRERQEELFGNLQETGSVATKAKEERVSVSLNRKYDIVAEKNSYIDPPEISVYIVEKQTGLIHQDICLVRHNLSSADDIQLLVWSREDCEDYSDEFNIPLYHDEDDA